MMEYTSVYIFKMLHLIIIETNTIFILMVSTEASW